MQTKIEQSEGLSHSVDKFFKDLSGQKSPDFAVFGSGIQQDFPGSWLAAWERSMRHLANPISSSETLPYTSPHNNLHRFFIRTTQELPTSQK